MKDGTKMKVGIMGHGVVGSGVAKILLDNAELIQTRARQPVELAKVLDLRTFDVPYAHLFTKNSQEITANPEIDIVVECMGGIEPAFTFLCDAIRHGKHAVTSNKEMVVAKGALLEALARENNVNFLYEASVAGGIPIVRPLTQCLSANHLTRIAGILNGTTNYILTRMKNEGVGFETALKEAQELGYAERNPDADVLGHDARRKICILAHAGFGAKLDDSQVECQGITGISTLDFTYAALLGSTIKLLAVAVNTQEGYYAYVGPTLVPLDHPLAAANDVFNAVMVTGDMVGDLMFYGRGAGTLPTASAICADVIDCVWHRDGQKAALRGVLHQKAISSQTGSGALFLRVAGTSQADALGVFDGARILTAPGVAGEFALITPCENNERLAHKLDRLKERAQVLQCLRVLNQ